MNRDRRQPDSFLLQQALQLTCAPVRSLLSQFHHLLLHPATGSCRAVGRPPALLHPPLVTTRLKTAPPLVSRGSRDLELLAQLSERPILPASRNHKPHPLFVHVHAA